MNRKELKKYADIRRRILDLHQNHAEAIERGLFIRVTAKLLPELLFLTQQLDDLIGDQVTEDETEDADAATV